MSLFSNKPKTIYDFQEQLEADSKTINNLETAVKSGSTSDIEGILGHSKVPEDVLQHRLQHWESGLLAWMVTCIGNDGFEQVVNRAMFLDNKFGGRLLERYIPPEELLISHKYLIELPRAIANGDYKSVSDMVDQREIYRQSNGGSRNKLDTMEILDGCINKDLGTPGLLARMMIKAIKSDDFATASELVLKFARASKYEVTYSKFINDLLLGAAFEVYLDTGDGRGFEKRTNKIFELDRSNRDRGTKRVPVFDLWFSGTALNIALVKAQQDGANNKTITDLAEKMFKIARAGDGRGMGGPDELIVVMVRRALSDKTLNDATKGATLNAFSRFLRFEISD